MDFGKITKLAESKGFTIGELAEKIDLAYSGLYRSIKESTIKVRTLEKIAEVLGVSVTVFFDSEYENYPDKLKVSNAKIEENDKRIAELESRIKDKEKLIQYMEWKFSIVGLQRLRKSDPEEYLRIISQPTLYDEPDQEWIEQEKEKVRRQK